MKKLIAGTILTAILAFGKPVQADELAIGIGRSYLNPTVYNTKISEVSSGEVYGEVNHLNINGKITREKLGLGLEAVISSQVKDAMKEDLNNNQVKYGENQMTLVDIIPSVGYEIPFLKTFGLEANIGPSLTFAYLRSTNETNSQSSLSTLLGFNVSAGVKKYFKNLFVRLKISYNGVLPKDDLNISGIRIGIDLGKRGKE